MKNRTILCAMLAFVAMSANAVPVYLQCSSFNKHSNKTTNYRITLDENAQTATFKDDGMTLGKTYTVPAQFTQTDVKFSWKDPSIGFVFNYSIDRTDMNFNVNFMGDPAKTDYGSCKIAEAVQRQF